MSKREGELGVTWSARRGRDLGVRFGATVAD